MTFFIKQLAGALATPLVIALLFTTAAGVLRLCGRRCTSTWFVVLAASIAYLGALPSVGEAFLAPLERCYPPFDEDKGLSITAIVVLGSGYEPRDGIPVTGSFDESGLARGIEGVRLARRYPSARLVVSGGALSGFSPPAIGYARLARDLGIPDASIVVLDKSLDTGDEARAVVQFLGSSPFVLVTSAYQMPRAMRLMERAGGHPIAAPTGYRTGGARPALWRALLPSAGALRQMEWALHEYLGLAVLAFDLD